MISNHNQDTESLRLGVGPRQLGQAIYYNAALAGVHFLIPVGKLKEKL